MKERAGVSTRYRQWPIERCVIAETVVACLFNLLFRAALCYTLIMFSGSPSLHLPPTQ